MKNIPLLFGTIVGSLVLVLGIAFFFSSGPGATSLNGTQQVADEPVDEATALGDARHLKGNPEAEITIIEFSDFQCPACRAAQPLAESVVEEYSDQVRLVYRHYPLVNIHQYAQLAAQAAETASEDDLFWEYHDLLFDNQLEWSNMKSQSEVEDAFVGYAEELGIDSQAFRERIKSSEVRSTVLQDVSDGTAVKITGTPTFFVNNQRVPAPQLKTTVESLLSEQE